MNIYKTCNIAILCDKYPINVRRGSFLARAMYVSLINNDKKTMCSYPDKLLEWEQHHSLTISLYHSSLIHLPIYSSFLNRSTAQ